MPQCAQSTCAGRIPNLTLYRCRLHDMIARSWNMAGTKPAIMQVQRFAARARNVQCCVRLLPWASCQGIGPGSGVLARLFSQAITYFSQRRNALVTFPRTRPRPGTLSTTATGSCNLSARANRAGYIQRAARRIKYNRIKHSPNQRQNGHILRTTNYKPHAYKWCPEPPRTGGLPGHSAAACDTARLATGNTAQRTLGGSFAVCCLLFCSVVYQLFGCGLLWVGLFVCCWQVVWQVLGLVLSITPRIEQT